MYKSRAQIVAIFILSSSVAFAVPFATKAEPKKQEQKKQQNMTNTLIQVQQWQKEDLEKYKGQLRATDIILKHEKDPTKKMELFFRRAFVHLMMAQMLGVNRTEKKVSNEELEHLNSAEKILNFYEPNVKNKPQFYASVQYMRGLISYEYSRFPEMISFFQSSMELDPNDRRAPSLSLIVAEFFYERDQYKEAIRYYNMHFSRLSDYQKDLSDYKTAWCYIGLVDYAKATDKLLSVILKKEKSKFRQDALKDLAFILTENKPENEIIALGQGRIQDLETRAEFFLLSLESYYAQAKMDNVTQLFTEVLKIQKTSLERLKTRFYKMEFARKEYPTLSQWEALSLFKKELDSANKEQIDKFNFSYGAKLEENCEHIIKIYTDAYNGKKIGPEKFEKAQILSVLLGAIELHIELFPKSQKLGLMWALWIDLCKENSQFACLNNLVSRLESLAKEKEAFRSYFERAAVSRLSLWDAAYAREAEKNFSGFVKDAELFLVRFPQSKEISSIRTRLAYAYMKQGKYEEAIGHYEIITKGLPNSPHQLDLAFCFFQLKKFDKVIDLRHVLLALKKIEALDILRESYLKRAILEKESGNTATYQQNLKEYLNLQKDISKRVLAYTDMFTVSSKDSNLNEVEKVWASIPVSEKSQPQIDPLRSSILEMMFETGDIRTMDHLDRPLRLPYLQLLYRAANKISLTSEDWKAIFALKAEQKEYFLSLLLIENPAEIKRHLSRPSSEFEKQLLSTAQSLIKGTLQVKKTKVKFISKLAPKYTTLVWPDGHLSPDKYSSRVEKIALDIRQLRKKVTAEIKIMDLEDKITLSKLAADSEKKCSEVIVNSPLPAGLTEEQKVEYKTGLADLAKEFSAQADVFQNLANELQAKLVEFNAAEEKKRIPNFDASKWNWPSGEVSEKARALAQKKSLFAGLFYLDRSFNQKKVTTTDYYSVRTALIAERFNSDAGKEFLKNELISAGQEPLLDQWKGISK